MRSFIVAAFRLFNKVIQVSHLLTSGKLKGVKGSYRGFSAARGVKGHYFCFPLFEESGLFLRG